VDARLENVFDDDFSHRAALRAGDSGIPNHGS